MNLRGQSENGYAMAALLVVMAVMAVMMSAAMPVWSQASRREKEAELVFRGQQYSRAIGLFQRKYANAPPPTIDVLVQERFLRKKYKDPITNADFVPVTALGATPAGIARGGGAGTATPGLPSRGATPPGAAGGGGGIVGVTSASREASIRIYNGASRYNEWRFVYAPPAATPGAGGGPGTAVPGQRGQPPTRGGPGGPGGPGAPNGRGFGGPGQGGPTRGGSGTGPQQPMPPARGR